MITTILPHHFKPRPYQTVKFDALFNKKFKRFVTVEHRRAGKDKTWFNILIALSQQRVGTYIHMLPTLTQAKKVIWLGMDKEGFPFLNHIPSNLIASINNSELRVKFKNGSILQLGGSDNYNSLMGTNPVWINFSEYSLTDPRAWDYFRPILKENNGGAAFIFTPRGNNHGHDLYKIANANPETWFTQLLTVNDTTDNQGNRIITPEMIAEERASGMAQELIDQEYFCSFSSALVGAYFGKEMDKAQQDGRIINFPIDPMVPVCTFWDIGTGDNTAIWLIQIYQNEFNAIAYYQNNNQAAQHYINWLHDFRDKNRIVYSKHYGPHDITKRDWLTNQTIMDQIEKLGIRFERVPRVKKKIDAINAARGILPQVIFHETNCRYGLECLRSYRQVYNDKLKIFLDEPLHDWASDGADAFETFAQSHNLYYLNQQEQGGVLANRVNQGRI